MHRTLQRQLRKLGLDADNPPQRVEEWHAFLQRIETAYQQADEGLYTLERSGDIAVHEMQLLNEQLQQSQKTLEASVREHTEDLQESEARNNTFLNMAPNAIIILDHAGRIVEFNATAEKMFGYQRKDTIGLLAADLIVPEAFRAGHTAALRHFDTNRTGIITPQPLELPAMRADGTEFPTEISLSAFLVNGKIFFTSIIQDITQRKTTERELVSIASFPEEDDAPVMRINYYGTVEYSNKPGQNILQTWGTRTGGKIPVNISKSIAAAFDDQPTTLDILAKERLYTLRFAPKPESGYINIYGTDITAQHQIEKDLVEARNQADKSNQSKSQFLAMMSHEIRTPMNGVMGMTELLLDTQLQDKQRHYADTIMKSSSSLLRVIDDVLDFSKIEADKLTLEIADFNLTGLLQELPVFFSEQLSSKNIELQLSTSSDLPEMVCNDSVRLRQILINLLSNAIKFTSEGNIQLLVKVLEHEKNTYQLLFEVIDSGIGMNKESCEQVFDSFTQADQTTTRLYGGTGLGLAIVKRLVRMMGGEVGVDSQPQKGSRFWFTIKTEVTDTQPAIQTVVTQNSNIASNINRKKILLAEDNLINQEVAVAMFELLGHEVDVVDNGHDALSAVTSSHYDLVCMDCQMPEMDGYEATQRIRQFESENNITHPVRIIALTANAMPADMDKCKNAGMDDFISKPFTLQNLESVL